MAVPFGALDPADGVGVRGGAQLAAGDAAEVVGDDVVIADAAALAMNAVESSMSSMGSTSRPVSSRTSRTDAGGERFTDFEHAAGERPVALEGLGAAANEEHAGLVDDDGADADEGRRGKLAFDDVPVAAGPKP
jgi:hypothetical protein